MSKFRNPDTGRTGFLTSVCLIPKPVHLQNATLPYVGDTPSAVVLEIHKDDATCTSGPRDEVDPQRQRATPGPPVNLWSTLSAPMTMQRRERSFCGKTHHYPGKGEPEGATEASPGLVLVNVSRDREGDETSI